MSLGVLLVGEGRDSDPFLRESIEELVPGRVRVDTAEDTHRALALLRDGEVDGVILLGTGSPESCAREIALLQSAAPDTEIVVIAPGYGPEGDAALRGSGAMELLSGPSADPPDLLRRLRWVLLRWGRYRELRQKESRFRTLTENISETVVVLEPDGTIRWATPSFEGLTGMLPADAIGRNAFEFIHPDDRDAAIDALTKVGRNEELPGPSEFRALHGDGSNPWIEASGRNLLELPAVQGIVVTMRDITERHALEAQLRDAQKMEAIGQLAGGIAHDFNNILTVLRGHSEFLLEEVTPGSPMHAEVEAIRAATQRAASLTSRLLAFSRRQVLLPRLLDPADVVLGMENMLSRLFSANIETRVEIQDHGAIRADQGQLEQVLLNLALNAKDAMPEGGRLVLRVKRDRISASEAARYPYRVVPGDYMVIEAEDSGHGMDEQVLSRVFEPFFTTKEVGSGTGLGLAMAYGVVKQSHGYVWADSTPGQGTSFRIYLPLVRP